MLPSCCDGVQPAPNLRTTARSASSTVVWKPQASDDSPRTCQMLPRLPTTLHDQDQKPAASPSCSSSAQPRAQPRFPPAQPHSCHPPKQPRPSQRVPRSEPRASSAVPGCAGRCMHSGAFGQLGPGKASEGRGTDSELTSVRSGAAVFARLMGGALVSAGSGDMLARDVSVDD